MAEVRLTEAVDEAEAAIESGNYDGAIETCQRILGQFPEFARAHRIMGEAFAEQGDLDAARQAYQRTLERDPQSIAAHTGLGMLAEDGNELESAVAHFQVAWEIDPRRRDLREHVSRVSQELYGSDGRLYLTRAALASLHFHAGRWDRAVSEAAQVLQELSSRIDVQVRLAEALWRRGDDEQARQVSSTVLRSLPQAVVPLLILADIERRQGNEQEARDLREKARGIDPDGVRATDLMMVGLDDQADFLAVDEIPLVHEQVVSEEPARYAPALDFMGSDEPEPADEPGGTDGLSQEDSGEPVSESASEPDVQPFSWSDVGDEDLEASDLESASEQPAGIDSPAMDAGEDESFDLLTDDELEQARPGADRPRGYTSMFSSLESEGMEPFVPEGEQDVVPEEPEQLAEESLDDLTLPTDEELDQARPGAERPRGFTGELSALEREGIEPFEPGAGEEDALAAQPDLPAEESDAVLDALSLASDEEVEEARPEDEMPRGYTGELTSLEGEGMEPFDPLAGVPAEPEEVPTPEEPAGEDELDFDWSRVDEEIEEAIPGETPRGHTDELEQLESVGLEPFDFDGDADDAGTDMAAPIADEEVPDEADLDELTQSWSEDEGSDETVSGEFETVDDSGLDSIGVVFDEEEQFDQQTERLRDVDDLWGEFAADDEPLPEPEVDTGEADEFGFDEMIEAFESESGTDTLPPLSDEPVDQPFEAEPVDEGSDLDTTFEAPLDDQEFDDAESGVAPWAGLSPDITAERLGLDSSLLERARQAKSALVERGEIQGDLLLAGGISLEDLSHAVEQEPENVDHRIALAAALTPENPDAALDHYRWIYRHAPDRGADMVDDLCRLADVMRERQVGVHRLLGAVYRRHGDWLAAANHYEESLSSSRRWQQKDRVIEHE